MNREIKFRAWDNEDKNMEEVGAIDWADGLPITCNTRTRKLYQMVPYDDRCGFILMQFTGLLDKNGKEIYEGDILAPDGGVVKEAGHFVVKWVEGGFYLQWSLNGKCEPLVRQEYIGVIGNIYENPDLLK